MNSREEDLQFDDVKRRLQPGDVFQSADHEWKTQKKSRWKGSCPWHGSSSGTCFTVDPETLKWKCFSCDRGGGPLQYVAELENVGTGARDSLEGKTFFRVWEALARHAGCAGPPDFNPEDGDTSSGRKSSDRKPRRNDRRRSKAPRRVGSASTTSKGGLSMSRDMKPPPGGPSEPSLDTPERELRKALSRYRNALTESEKARRYVEGRGLSVETMHAYGCGFAPAGEWIGSDNAPRLVTPHTTPSRDSSNGGGRLVNLSGRYLGTCPKEKRHRHVTGNSTALFNASAIGEGSGPLVLCEGPLDALSFIEAGHARTVALHNTDGVPWDDLRGNVSAVVFAFDTDDTGTEDAGRQARKAALRGYDAHTLHDEDAYSGHNDPNDALQAGELSLDYLERIGTENDGQAGNSGTAESRETAAKSGGPEADRSPTQQKGSTGDGEGAPTAADLVAYWNGDDIGHLGRWLWERGGVPEGEVSPGLYADRELHAWIEEKLEAGPQATGKQEQIRLRWVLWKLYAAHGPEDVPDWQIPIPPMRKA